MDDRWAKLEEIVRRVVREELSTISSLKKKRVDFKNGRFVGIGEVEMAALRAAYPAVDVEKELKEMSAWIIMNPDEAPASNYGAFVNTWLRKHQNQHSLRSVPSIPREEVKRRACGYCPADATGSVNGIPHCRAHTMDAMDEKPRRMLGVVAKPVSGAD